jgi:hypothetical protein
MSSRWHSTVLYCLEHDRAPAIAFLASIYRGIVRFLSATRVTEKHPLSDSADAGIVMVFAGPDLFTASAPRKDFLWK